MKHNIMLPKVSLCTPTFNRRPFIPHLIKCVENQTYPKELIEWIIIDDGTDDIEDLVQHISYVHYIRISPKIPLGEKRNMSHQFCNGDIIIYMDDDDYYPPQRVEHAVETLLQNPDKLIAGAKTMNIYFKHNKKMYLFGPYGENRITAATFAFRRELLQNARYNDAKCLAEEKEFLNNFTIPIAELDTNKTILVMSHIHNTFDKKELLAQGENNPYVKISTKTLEDFISDPEELLFYAETIDKELETYLPGNITNKPDVLLQKYMIENERYRRELTASSRKLEESIRQLNFMKQENERLTTMNNLMLEQLKKIKQNQINKYHDSWTLLSGNS